MGSNALTVPAHACLVMTLQSMLMCALVLYADGSSSKNVMSVLTFEAAILVFVLASAILTTGIAMLVEVISPSRRRVMNVLTGAGLCAFLFLTQISSEFRSGPGVGQRSVLGISSVFYSASPTATLEALDRLGWRFTGSGYSNIRLNERPRDPTWPAADPVDQLTFYLVFWFVVGLLGAASFGLAIKIHSRRVRRLLGGSTW